MLSIIWTSPKLLSDVCWKSLFAHTSSVKPKFHLARHVTTWHYLAHTIWHRKQVVTCYIALVLQHGATRVMTSATHTTRVQGHRHSVDWGGHIHLSFSRSCSWDWCKSKEHYTKLLHASTTAALSSAMLEQARLDTHDKRDTLVTTHTTRCTCRIVTWRNKWNLGFSA